MSEFKALPFFPRRGDRAPPREGGAPPPRLPGAPRAGWPGAPPPQRTFQPISGRLENRKPWETPSFRASGSARLSPVGVSGLHRMLTSRGFRPAAG